MLQCSDVTELTTTLYSFNKPASFRLAMDPPQNIRSAPHVTKKDPVTDFVRGNVTCAGRLRQQRQEQRTRACRVRAGCTANRDADQARRGDLWRERIVRPLLRYLPECD